ncbi:MAG: transcription-repair coupling factor [Planctomycetes bacterium]|nr:transcription-repair coupling factor [Planctomycetota bacterium]
MIKTITSDHVYRALVARLQEGGRACAAEGLWGSSAPILAALLAADTKRTLLFVTAHLEQADECRDDMELVASGVDMFPAFETLPGEGSARGEIVGERIRVCNLLSATKEPQEGAGSTHRIIIAPIQALMQPVPKPEVMAANSRTLSSGADSSMEELLTWLVDRGYARLDWVEEPGDFAVRGGIVDVYAHDYDAPLRLEFFGDTVESIRLFDLSNQRSQQDMPSVRISGVANVQKLPARDATNLLVCLPEDAIVFWHEFGEIQELGQTMWERLDNPRGMFPVQNVFKLGDRVTQIHSTRLGGMSAAAEDMFRFEVQSVQRFEVQPAKAIEELMVLAQEKHITVFCENDAEQHRFKEVVVDSGRQFPKSIELAMGFLHGGFEWAPAGRIFVGHHELFQRYRQHRKIRKAYAARPLESWLDINIGDFVVHAVHGIAKFNGMAPIRKGQSTKREEFMTLEFSDRAIIHVPVSQIDLVQKYIGAGGVNPSLSVLGGKRWKNAMEKVERAVADFAGELLQVQALRDSLPGTAYPPDTSWQREFEASFIYTETEDQVKVLEEIKADLLRERPMDRLICGDVGYGKTELAMRAAFKVVEFGKQVAVLVPTTVLAEQHYKTFRERLADYPFIIERLSRFRSAKEQKQLVEATRKGQVDILIGTHRLLSGDIGFADLGLLIVDEEQRFGVEHKERLKRIRESVDVLTLTATPIPRTLHMSMLGIRDISALATPPMDRRSIVTQVRQYDPDLIRSGIIRELNRDGQVFFVHNLVHDIEAVADDIRRIVPEARILVGHGQMRGDELERVMLRFIQHEVDVLVCTTIIESGIDIPTANTIFIDQADRFGLADMHQLRGRVGRYRHRAYCYLLLPRSRTISPVAAKRLKAIEEYSQLGSGFRIAMRDLEIRGAGNILGAEQSGNIATVGYEMYCKLLDATVRRMKGEQDRAMKPVHLELGVAAYVPKGYVRSDNARMEIYRRLSACQTLEDSQRLETDLDDAFGPHPAEVGILLELANLRILAQPWSIRSIIVKKPDLIFQYDDLSKAEAVFRSQEGLAGVVRMPDPRTIHWRVPDSYFEPKTLLAVLRKRLSATPALAQPV